jgi:CheY-like chemotaxis protein
MNGPRDILLVDDDPNDVDIALRALRRDGIDVHVSVAHGGEEALEVLGVDATSAGHSATRPSVVFLDLKMPGIDGWEVLERLRSHPETETLPVVVLSWSGAPEDVSRCYALGANSYLVKHFEGERPGAYFAQAVRYWIGLNHAPGDAKPLRTS